MVDPYIPDCGDIVWMDFDPQAGREQAGRRPALILSPMYFNKKSSVAYACPITSKVKGYRFQVVLPHGLPVHGAILCEHLRSLDWRIRNAAFMGRIPESVLSQVREVIGLIAGIAT